MPPTRTPSLPACTPATSTPHASSPFTEALTAVPSTLPRALATTDPPGSRDTFPENPLPLPEAWKLPSELPRALPVQPSPDAFTPPLTPCGPAERLPLTVFVPSLQVPEALTPFGPTVMLPPGSRVAAAPPADAPDPPAPPADAPAPPAPPDPPEPPAPPDPEEPPEPPPEARRGGWRCAGKGRAVAMPRW